MSALGALNDLPADYLRRLEAQRLTPLWPMLRNFMPYGLPARRALPHCWSYAAARPLLDEAGELTPIERAERRVLVLCNPGYAPEEAQATATIYLGLQLIKPGEFAPPHRHSAAAIRMVIEGEGAFTAVGDEKLPMEPCDLILTPAGLWHEHGHEGEAPAVWLDALDLPLSFKIEACYSEDGRAASRSLGPEALDYLGCGLAPAGEDRTVARAYPKLRYAWKDVKRSLDAYASRRSLKERAMLRYINPLTGGDCLPTFSMAAWKLRPGEEAALPRRSCSSVFHILDGAGEAAIDGAEFRFETHDTLAAPTHADIRIRNSAGARPAYLFSLDDSPVHRALGIFETFSDPRE